MSVYTPGTFAGVPHTTIYPMHVLADHILATICWASGVVWHVTPVISQSIFKSFYNLSFNTVVVPSPIKNEIYPTKYRVLTGVYKFAFYMKDNVKNSFTAWLCWSQ